MQISQSKLLYFFVRRYNIQCKTNTFITVDNRYHLSRWIFCIFKSFLLQVLKWMSSSFSLLCSLLYWWSLSNFNAIYWTVWSFYMKKYSGCFLKIFSCFYDESWIEYVNGAIIIVSWDGISGYGCCQHGNQS